MYDFAHAYHLLTCIFLCHLLYFRYRHLLMPSIYERR
nr:MAG TPA: hypothetical protein [Caudoviricetes sp.]DAY62885.1 MAG TPA: hypothetical protein [Caudoviricetes sp.]